MPNSELPNAEFRGGKGSKRWNQAVTPVSRLREEVGNQRLDPHNLIRDLENTYSLAAIEDLDLKFMTRKRYLSLTSHNAYAHFV